MKTLLSVLLALCLPALAAAQTVVTTVEDLHVKGNATVDGTLTGTVNVTDTSVVFTDNTTGNTSTSKHGFMLKLSGNAGDVFHGDGTWSAGGVGVNLNVNTLCEAASSPTACFTLGPTAAMLGGLNTPPNLANMTVLSHNATLPDGTTLRNQFSVVGYDDGTGNTAWIELDPPRIAGTAGTLVARGAGSNATTHLQLSSYEDGWIQMGNEDTSEILIANGAQAPRGLATTRADAGIGVQDSGGNFKEAFIDSGVLGLFKIVQGNPCGGCGGSTSQASVETGMFSSSASEVISSSSTIAPTHSIFHVSGTAAIATITAPTQCQHTCTIMIIPDGAFTTTTSGNIATAVTAIANDAMKLVYDGTKWYVVHGY